MNTKFFGAVALLVSLLAAPAFAQNRTHKVTWAHPDPGSVSHFLVLVSSVEGEIEGAREVNVGLPEPVAAGGHHLYSAMVSFEASEYLAVRAVGHAGLVSAPSSWGSMPPTRPGQPLPVGY
jgi:hypothetical protein